MQKLSSWCISSSHNPCRYFAQDNPQGNRHQNTCEETTETLNVTCQNHVWKMAKQGEENNVKKRTNKGKTWNKSPKVQNQTQNRPANREHWFAGCLFHSQESRTHNCPRKKRNKSEFQSQKRFLVSHTFLIHTHPVTVEMLCIIFCSQQSLLWRW